MEGAAEWPATGLENQGDRKVKGSIPSPSASMDLAGVGSPSALLKRGGRKANRSMRSGSAICSASTVALRRLGKAEIVGSIPTRSTSLGRESQRFWHVVCKTILTERGEKFDSSPAHHCQPLPVVS